MTSAAGAQRRLLQWLTALVTGRCEPLEIDDEMVRLLARARLTELVAARCGGNDRALRDSFARSAGLERASRHCLGLLEAAGLPATTLKGPALAARFWGDAAARVSCDVDLLVAPAQVKAAVGALEAEGHERANAFPHWYEPRWHYHAVLLGPSPVRTPIELHWGIARPGLARVDVAGIIAGSEATRCLFGDLSAPSPPWQLLIAVLHATRHHFPLRDLLDVAFIARALDEREWSIAVREARRAAVGPSLYYSLSLVEDRFGLRLHRSARELRPSRARDAIVRPYLDSLPVVGNISRSMMQVGKVVIPLSTSTLSRLPGGLVWSLTDRPRVAGWVDDGARRVRRLAARDRRR